MWEPEIAKLKQIQQLAGEVIASLSGNTILVPIGSSIQSAINSAPSGSTLLLEQGTYVENIRINQPVTIRYQNPVDSPGASMPCWIRGNGPTTIEVTNMDSSNWVNVLDVGVANDTHSGDGIDIYGIQTLVQRVSIFGDAVEGMHRGILTNGNVIRLNNIWMDNIFQIRRDSTGFGGWEGRDLIATNLSICAGAYGFLFGGADSSSDLFSPSQIDISNFHLTKKPEWVGMGVNIKTGFELKDARDVHIWNGYTAYAGIAEGQGGYAMLLTVRNQDGNAPWATIRNVVIEDVQFAKTAGCCNILGQDDQNPSVKMTNVTIRNCTFLDIDGQKYTGDGRCFLFNNAPDKVTLEALTIQGQNLNQLGYFPLPDVKPTNLTMRNWVFPETLYGWFQEDGPHDIPPDATHLKEYMPDMTYEITANDSGASK
jgi:hypothetical protein